jgi:hypothetical protein
MNVEISTPTTKKCSKSWCKQQVPLDAKYKACNHCWECDRRTKESQRASDKAKKISNMCAVGQKDKRHKDATIDTEARLPVWPRIEEDKSDCDNRGTHVKVCFSHL